MYMGVCVWVYTYIHICVGGCDVCGAVYMCVGVCRSVYVYELYTGNISYINRDI